MTRSSWLVRTQQSSHDPQLESIARTKSIQQHRKSQSLNQSSGRNLTLNFKREHGALVRTDWGFWSLPLSFSWEPLPFCSGFGIQMHPTKRGPPLSNPTG